MNSTRIKASRSSCETELRRMLGAAIALGAISAALVTIMLVANPA